MYYNSKITKLTLASMSMLRSG